MDQTLDRVVYHLDCRNDFKGLDIIYFNAIDQSMPRFLKSIVRGGVEGGLIGATIGSLYSLLSGDFSIDAVKTGALVGGGIGAVVDFGQYYIRWERYFGRD